MKRIILFIFFCQAFAVSAFAGREVGNGGESVVCRDSNGSVLRVEFFDLYEARILRNISPEWQKKSFGEKLDLAFSRIGAYAIKRETVYRTYFTSFFNEAALLKDVVLVHIEDANHIFIPANCKIEQLVIQIEPKFTEDPRYVINKDLWDYLDEDSKAATVLHEIIYREAIQQGHKNSTSVRYFNSQIFSNRLSHLSASQYTDLMQSLNLPIDFQSQELAHD